ncbi:MULTISPECIES: ribosome recycling factor [Aerococcus]|uniref:ribosome recycling factor n=1 Tax=Aerococcus TaxID=1375 RepID=UPI0018A7055E|nr:MULTISPECIES: ribosome recycling factor [Aerococcus]MCY3035824.1 ribosome recycling factor [Aerococcus sp. Group 2]MCY3038919.1 ribosome recycling factor [Aerococcus sp. Group 2]MCY3040491.1 ribosome recycling factor [Aerococcus sp. Group 2]MCY3042488.1 ribosome recycling factor [Aerococcus sp. Group 2]MDK6519936.1 ribosome recycling factor [Aerococcus urinae]
MDINNLFTETKNRMKKSEQSLQNELGKIRAGVANASLLNGIYVEYYGVETPLNQIASITIPEPRMLMVTPYDRSALDNIDRAIQMSDIGIAPTNDGEKIRLVIPALTQERRQELSKLVGRDLEDAKIAIRNIRRDANDAIKKAEKDGEITEDDARRNEKEVQKITDEVTERLDKIASDKEDEILNS